MGQPQSKESCTDLKDVCDVCSVEGKSTQANDVCVECMELLCSGCVNVHSMNKVLKTHRVVRKDVFGKSFTSNTLHKLKDILHCKEHGIAPNYICEGHKELICDMCIKRTHRECKTITKLGSSVDSVKERIQEFQIRLENAKQRKAKVTKTIRKEKESVVLLQMSILNQIEEFLKQPKETSPLSRFEGLEELEKDLTLKAVNAAEIKLSNEELLYSVLNLIDENRAVILAEYVNMSLKESEMQLDQLTDVELSISQASTIFQNLKTLQSVTNEIMQCMNTSNPETCVRLKSLSPMQGYIADRPCFRTTETQTDVDSQTNLGNYNDDTKATQPLSYRPAVRTVDTQTDYDRSVLNDSDSFRDTLELRVTSSGSVSGRKATSLVDSTTMTQASQVMDNSSQTMTQTSQDMDNSSQTSSTGQQATSSVPLSRRSIEFAGTYNICLDDEILNDVSGIVVLNANSIVVAEYSYHMLKLFDDCFKLQHHIQIQSAPLSACRLDTNRVAVSLSSRRVNIYMIYEHKLYYQTGFDTGLHCRGICRTPDNKLAILLSNVSVYDRETGSVNDVNSISGTLYIQIRNGSNGRIVDTINFSRKVDTPIFIIHDDYGRLIVGEVIQVTAFDNKGESQWFYKSYQGIKLEGIQGLDIDPEGNIYACGQTSTNIHQVSTLNYKCNRVLIPDVPKARSVAFDPYKQRIIVGCDSCKGLYVYNFVN